MNGHYDKEDTDILVYVIVGLVLWGAFFAMCIPLAWPEIERLLCGVHR